jgi:hypothetical protein
MPQSKPPPPPPGFTLDVSPTRGGPPAPPAGFTLDPPVEPPAVTTPDPRTPDYATIIAQGFNPESRADRFRRGVQDFSDRGVQISMNVGEKLGLLEPGLTDIATGQINKEREAYEKLRQDAAKRAGKEEAGFDGYRALGTAATLAPLALLSRGRALPAIARDGALIGGAGGALTYDPTNTFKATAVNTAIGGTLGLVLSPPLAVAGQFAGKAIGALLGRVKGAIASMGGKASPAQIIQAVPEVQQLPPAQQSSLINEAAQQVRASGELNAEALGRKANLVANDVTPLKSMVTRNPQDWALERNLSKLTGPDADLARIGGELTDVYRANDAALGSRLRTLNQGRPQGTQEGLGQSGMKALDDVAKETQQQVGGLYEVVRQTRGNELASDARQLYSTLDDLSDSTYAKKIVDSTRNRLRRFGMIDKDGNLTNKTLTVYQAEELRKFVNTLPEDYGKKQIIGAIDQDVLGGLGDDAFGVARAAAEKRFELIGNPATQKALNTYGELQQGKTAQNFIKQQVVNAADQDVDALLGTLATKPDAVNSLRSGVIGYFEEAAINPNSGQFSGARFNKAVVEFGDKKLTALFGADEAAKIKSLARASLDATYQPPYSAVNSSNTTPIGLSLTRRGRQALGFNVPFLNEAVEQAAARSGYQSQLNNALSAKSTPGVSAEFSRQLAIALSRAGATAAAPLADSRRLPADQNRLALALLEATELRKRQEAEARR